jgi:CheY-like chemotaxis protein
MDEAKRPQSSTSRLRVLVVEDHPFLRPLMVNFLSRHDIHTFDAADAVSAHQIVREQEGRIDLAVVDMVMPGPSGLDFASELLREYPAIRILYISGYTDSIAMDVISRRSPDAVLLKPFTEESLLERVFKLLELPFDRKSPPPDAVNSAGND